MKRKFYNLGMGSDFKDNISKLYTTESLEPFNTMFPFLADFENLKIELAGTSFIGSSKSQLVKIFALKHKGRTLLNFRVSSASSFEFHYPSSYSSWSSSNYCYMVIEEYDSGLILLNFYLTSTKYENYDTNSSSVKYWAFLPPYNEEDTEYDKFSYGVDSNSSGKLSKLGDRYDTSSFEYQYLYNMVTTSRASYKNHYFSLRNAMLPDKDWKFHNVEGLYEILSMPSSLVGQRFIKINDEQYRVLYTVEALKEEWAVCNNNCYYLIAKTGEPYVGGVVENS